LRGCDPENALVGASEAFDLATQLTGQGGDRCIDWPAQMRRKRGFTEPVPTVVWRNSPPLASWRSTGRPPL
jgi:pyruvate/2-oxoglutarate dehydrogenase complex dihydrolipoamide dehydrogenase (E3) component